MAAGALVDEVIAVAMTGPPVLDTSAVYWVGLLYLALVGVRADTSASTIRSSAGSVPRRPHIRASIVPIIAMGFSTWLEDYRWTPLAVAGALLALGGMAGALSGRRVADRGSRRGVMR